MARKSKIEPENGADVADSQSAEPKKKARSASTKPKAKKPAAKKKSPAATISAPAPADEPTDDAIRIRAYFLAERRLRLSLPGDSAHDWIEARRQLIEESGPASS